MDIINRSVIAVIGVMVIGFGSVNAQSNKSHQTGTVSYVTSARVYVRFENTTAMLAGDTLHVVEKERFIPVLVIDQKSSLSCVGKPINQHSFKKGDVLHFTGHQLIKDQKEATLKNVLVKKQDNIKGSFSLANYSSISTATDFNTRNVARLRLKAKDLITPGLSLNTYLIYRRNLESSESGIVQDPGLFNIYGLSLQYAKEENYSISLGRKVNRRVASLGMMDGLHVEKQLGKIHIGAIAGFRPDQINNTFNSNLLQYGGYLGANHTIGKKRIEATIGLLEQKNGSNIDRRYMYMQGSANLGSGLSLFSSAEMDLYTLDSTMQEAGNRLTNFHLAANYRLSKRVRVSMSYDTRKQIIFYETFQTQLERLIADDQARQGIRARVNIKVTKGLTAGFAYGKRYQSSMDNASNNYNAFATLRNTPIIGGTLSGNININQSSYLNSISTTFRHNRYYLKNKLNASTYLRSVLYSYNPERDVTIIQQFVGTSVMMKFGKGMSLRGLVEFSLRKAEYRNRVNLQLIKRF